MKKSQILFSLLCALTITLTSCEKDDDMKTTETETEKVSVAGTWYVGEDFFCDANTSASEEYVFTENTITVGCEGTDYVLDYYFNENQDSVSISFIQYQTYPVTTLTSEVFSYDRDGTIVTFTSTDPASN